MSSSDPHRVKPTRVESADDIRQWQAPQKGQPLDKGTRAEAAPAPAAMQDSAQPLRPTIRPPQAMLCVLDDGQGSGEWHRLRRERTVVGRTEGEILIEHDTLLSANHFEIVRRRSAAGWRWYVCDLGSTNGTFVRVEGVTLNKPQEFLIGSKRLRFLPPASADDGNAASGTRAWQTITPEEQARAVANLCEVTPEGEGPLVPLVGSEFWIGSDRDRVGMHLDDPFVSARHARVYVNAEGRWRLDNNKSLNGVWVKIGEIPITDSAELLAGEQRFIVQVLP